MLNNLVKTSIALLLLSVIQPAHATFEKHSLYVEGDNKSILDTRTGVEWMAASVTQNMSINQVIAEIAPGGALHGWQFPTLSQMETLMLGFIPAFEELLPNPNYYISGGAYFSGIKYRTPSLTFQNYFGTNRYYFQIYHGTSFYAPLADGSMMIFTSTVDIPSNVNGNTNFNAMHMRIYVDHENLNYDTSTDLASIFLVSNGGDSLSSRSNPYLNVMNPDAPINVGAQGVGQEQASDVPLPFMPASLGLLFALGLFRKTKNA